MTSKIDLKKIEKKALTSYHQDGLIEILVGLVFILYGSVLLAGKAGFIGLCWLPAILIVPFKKKITVPRMGFVTFRSSRKVKISKAALIIFIIGALTFLIIFLNYRTLGITDWIDQNLIFIIGILVAIPPLIGAYLIRIKRFYFYSVLIAGVFFVENFFTGSFPYNSIIFGLILLTSGTIVLIRFLQKYPKPESEVTSG
jgi:hypothetical protein